MAVLEKIIETATKPVSKTVDGLYNIFLGMYTVFKNTSRDPITSSYPTKMPELYSRSRHRLALNVDPDTGEHLCIACKQCERVCPDTCISVIAHPDVKAKSSQFYIDHGLCMFCGLCTEVCPTDCIINTVDFEMSEENREDLIYDIRKLTLTQEQSRAYFQMKGYKTKREKAIEKANADPSKKPPAEGGISHKAVEAALAALGVEVAA
ncbi:MAG: NADH-quinone oxidoreductase subunit I [Candidatus Melainabacteria bacterium]|nr:NADH-quinone oxidoreductase subunit I [Candidatus Melainabacteria bacterium]